MPNHHVEITRPDPETGETRVVIDGTDMSREITSLSVDMAACTLPKITVELLVIEDLRLCSADAELVIGRASVDLLERHGWTRPEVKA